MAISSDFEMFVPGPRKRGKMKSDKPLASVCGSGMLRFNEAARDEYDLTHNTHVLVFYSAKKEVLGLKIVDPGTKNAVKFYNSKDEEALPCMGIKKLMKDFGLGKVTQSARDTAFIEDENMILIYNVEQLDEKASFDRALDKAGKK